MSKNNKKEIKYNVLKDERGCFCGSVITDTHTIIFNDCDISDVCGLMRMDMKTLNQIGKGELAFNDALNLL